MTAAGQSSRPECSKTCAGWELTGPKGRTGAANTLRTLRASGGHVICACGRHCVTADLSIPALVHEKTWPPLIAAPNHLDDEPIYPGTCRARDADHHEPAGVNWRFRIPEGEQITFLDLHFGEQAFVAGRDFGDFVVWRRDDVPAYQLAVVADDHAMRITEVVRGADLLKSTARQLLLYRALRWAVPDFYHCDLVRDEAGARLAKRHDALSIRALRESGWTAEQVRARAFAL